MKHEKVTFPNGRGQMLAGRIDYPVTGDPIGYALYAHCFTCTKNLRAIGRITPCPVNVHLVMFHACVPVAPLAPSLALNSARLKRKPVNQDKLPARWLDRIGLRLFRRPTSDLHVSDYYARARKQGYWPRIFARQRAESGLRSLLKLLNCAEARANLYSSTVVNAW